MTGCPEKPVNRIQLLPPCRAPQCPVLAAATLAPADWAVIALYLAGIIALGLWLGRGQRTTRDYFLGGRDLPWWSVAFSIIATETSAVTFIAVPAAAYGGNLGFIQAVIGFAIARIVLAVWLVPYYFKGEIYSPYEMVGRACGQSARRTVAGLFLVAGALAAGVRVYVICIPLELMLPVSIGAAIWLFVGLSLVYTYAGGIRAVVWTDAVQFILLIGGGIFVFFHLAGQHPGGLSTAFGELNAKGKLDWLNTDFTLGGSLTIWMGIFGATFLTLSTHGADQLIVQRVLACRTQADGRRALVLSALLILPLILLFLLIGALLFYHHDIMKIPLGMPAPEVQPGMKQNDYLLPIYLVTALPPIVKGVLIVALLAAAMSSVSSALSAMASVFTMDIRQRAGDEANALRDSKRATLAAALVLIGIGHLCQGAASALTLAFKLSSLTSGALLGALAWSLWQKKSPPPPIIAGMLVSLVLMSAIAYGVPGEQFAWPWYTLTGTIITLITTKLVTPAYSRKTTPL
ncbi:MAG: hypothetical protein CMO74_13230 [Verrucomicrobiales bacterium]|nr:hypothetical protein [Verrucomicrobiales bacterium]|tara:strand:+ start:30313 stop:31866 length:1554 start_codon:yes stop_codon:yes gene_type:complete